MSVTEAASCQNIVLDNYYNNEFNAQGQSYHYLWNDTTIGGFSQLGQIFSENHCKLGILKKKPTPSNLKKAQIYIIVDPDNEKDTKTPNYMDEKAATDIAKWVHRGGKLLLLANDISNCDLQHFNLLANKFGMSFLDTTLYLEAKPINGKRNFNSCAVTDLPAHHLFIGVNKIFFKGIAPIKCDKPAKAVLMKNNNILIAESHYGKGYVLAVGDPWLYNEYIDHYLLPKDFDNYKTAQNLVKLLLSHQ
jgi:unsaturated rhamnogalacturonyl hydrolase